MTCTGVGSQPHLALGTPGLLPISADLGAGGFCPGLYHADTGSQETCEGQPRSQIQRTGLSQWMLLLSYPLQPWPLEGRGGGGRGRAEGGAVGRESCSWTDAPEPNFESLIAVCLADGGRGGGSSTAGNKLCKEPELQSSLVCSGAWKAKLVPVTVCDRLSCPMKNCHVTAR